VIAGVVHRHATLRRRDRRTRQRAGARPVNAADAPDPVASRSFQTTPVTPGVVGSPGSMRFLEIGLACGAIATAVLIGLVR